MASKRMIRREQKRTVLVAKHYDAREALKKQLKDPMIRISEKFKLLEKLQKMGRDASAVRLNRRCLVTGRAHGVYRRFKLCRNELRRRVMRGEVPGVFKASW